MGRDFWPTLYVVCGEEYRVVQKKRTPSAIQAFPDFLVLVFNGLD